MLPYSTPPALDEASLFSYAFLAVTCYGNYLAASSQVSGEGNYITAYPGKNIVAE